MSDYREARREAISHLDFLAEIREEYLAIRAGKKDSEGQEKELIRDNELSIRQSIEAISGDPRLQEIVMAEPVLNARATELGAFLRWLHEQGIFHIDLAEQPQAMTKTPPEPEHEITGDAVVRYLKELDEWLSIEARSLWGDEDNPLEEVRQRPLPQRFCIGDFGMANYICQVLGEGAELKRHWLRLASCGDYWDTVPVGAARARLLIKGAAIISQLLAYPTDS